AAYDITAEQAQQIVKCKGRNEEAHIPARKQERPRLSEAHRAAILRYSRRDRGGQLLGAGYDVQPVGDIA
ncbi:MAG: hypothetical protein Q4A05_07560, partial [Ruminococcus sp.]|nr:hypothetical protein [Ruminococcus sp.]